ncbi:MAG: hypothetical protein U5R06_13365 [candidate division KSB1 bacterium]|nr:hypothetical protein [candidate division KSB1 bacterium]
MKTIKGEQHCNRKVFGVQLENNDLKNNHNKQNTIYISNISWYDTAGSRKNNAQNSREDEKYSVPADYNGSPHFLQVNKYQ